MSRNAEIASRFKEFAALLEAQDVEYKPRSYRRAAENLRGYPEPIENLASEGENAVSEIEGVGDAIAAKIVEYVETGAIEELEELRAELPVDMAALTNVEGVGPKTVGTLYYELGVEDLTTSSAQVKTARSASFRGSARRRRRTSPRGSPSRGRLKSDSASARYDRSARTS